MALRAHRTAFPVDVVLHRSAAGIGTPKRVPIFGTVWTDTSRYPGSKVRELTAARGIHRRRVGVPTQRSPDVSLADGEDSHGR